MKAVILAGGTGSRLRPVTYTRPKQLIPIANRPVLSYAVDRLTAAGIEEIGIVLGNHGRDAIRETIGDGDRWRVDITYIVQGDARGLADAVGCAREFVGEDPFVVYLGDDMIQGDVSTLIDGFDPRPSPRIASNAAEKPKAG